MAFPKKSPSMNTPGTGAGSVSLHGKTVAVKTKKPSATGGNVSLHGKTAAVRKK